ncbi:hypothetical protein ACFVFF_38780 [Streptomyces sp. NPDC057680]|uniref:hypothetical protein n=1 Tax=Streptomyces sp. NPDC057680 TaxID=3346208 RepID=UPI00369CCEDD
MISMTRPQPALGHRPTQQLLDRMCAEGDARAERAGRRARRTLQEMDPSYVRQPLLTLHRPVMAGGACPVCERFSCDGTDCPPAAAVASASTPPAATGGQCSSCGGWFEGWNGGICSGCKPAGH